MSQRVSGLILAFLMFGVSTPSLATSIEYEISNISGNTWEYSYEVFNDSLSVDIEDFVVYFDYNLYENLVAVSTPLDWDPLVLQPDTGLPSDGVYDVLALSIGIVPGDSLGGFTVQFDFLGTGIPGAQTFDVVDASSFDLLDGGMTVLRSSRVPEPGLLLLLGFGLMGLARGRLLVKHRR